MQNTNTTHEVSNRWQAGILSDTMMRMGKILITGASGFIGRCAAAAFRNAGWETIPVGRRSTSLPNYVQQDLSQQLSTTILQHLKNTNVVLHAAARSSPWGTRRQFHQDNVEATQRLLDACESCGRPRFHFVSSSSVYYRPEDQLQISEATAQASPPVNLYAETKQQAEQRVRAYSGAWTIFRPRAVYGPGDTVLFPRILAAARAGRLPLLTREHSPVIGDLIYIDNLIRCFMKAATDPTIHGDFNLTDGQPVEIIGFLLSVFDQLNIPHPSKTIPVRKAFLLAGMIETMYRLFAWWKEPPITRFGVHVFAWSKTFDVQKMRSTFGDPPTSSAEGVRRFVAWIQQENPYA